MADIYILKLCCLRKSHNPCVFPDKPGVRQLKPFGPPVPAVCIPFSGVRVIRSLTFNLSLKCHLGKVGTSHMNNYNLVLFVLFLFIFL